ncbi:extracellular solute-binding protein [Leifsonia sp. YAF41]|uniref:extracellular solute-binding protein n=1 Tax=Leifsonia sp. YAF41 TaxID=3233086 RepID=UPI003F9433FA
MRRKARSAVLTGVIAVALSSLVLSGCAADVKPKTEPTGDAAAPAQSLTIYTGRDKDEVASVVAQFETAYPQYKGKVQTVIAGAQDNLDRMRAEKSNPQGGFLWGGTQQQFEQAASEGLLEPYEMKSADKIADGRKDADNQWFAEMLLPEIIIYNNTLVEEKDAPKDWADLLDPKWKDKIVIRDVMASGTMRTIYSSMVYDSFAKDGSPDAGYDFLTKLDANTVSYAANPDDMYTQLDQGTGVITLWNLQDALIQPLKNNRPWSYVMPSSGAPVLLDGVGIIKNKNQDQAAKDFEDFLMDPKLQASLADQYYQVPAMEIAEADKPDWLAKLKIKEMDIDWNVLGENQDAWMTYWADNIKGKGGA